MISFQVVIHVYRVYASLKTIEQNLVPQWSTRFSEMYNHLQKCEIADQSAKYKYNSNGKIKNQHVQQSQSNKNEIKNNKQLFQENYNASNVYSIEFKIPLLS